MSYRNTFSEMKTYLLLWFTQLLSALGSAMTSYALVIWAYQQHGSALETALLMVCSYAPYVVLSIFAGTLSDRWDKRKTMLVCDACAALCTITVLYLLQHQALELWHLYALNVANGIMNTVQQPASEVATTLLLPRKHYQKAGSLRYLSNACSSILTPVIATAFIGLWGIEAVVAFDLITFGIAFAVLLLWIRIPAQTTENQKETFWMALRGGLAFLREHRGILDLMLFLAAINLVASMYNAAFPAMMLSRAGAGEKAMGIVNAVTGVTMLAGSLASAAAKPPKSRVRMICNTLLISMSTENFFLAFGRSVPVWCLGAFLGWIAIPFMNANLDAVMRLHIPHELQGRVFAARNSFQFFTIPIGYFLGGFAVDRIFEPLMLVQQEHSWLTRLFGSGRGSGAACFFAVLACAGIAVCICFRRDRHIWALEKDA